MNDRAALLSSDFIGALADVESRFPVLQWQVGGVAVWPLLRVRWMFAEWAASTARRGAGDRVQPAGAGRRLRDMAAGATRSLLTSLTDTRAQERGSPRRDLVFLSDGLSFARIGNTWVERFCDPLILQAKQLGSSSALWTPLHRYFKPRHSPSTFMQPGVDRASVSAMLMRPQGSGDAVLPGHDGVVGTLASHGFGTASLGVEKILSDARRLRSVADFYRAQLQRVRPAVAFVVSYYALEGFAFVLACREAGVVSVDLQHGVQGRWHPAYGAVPRPPGRVHALLPDRFWVWSEQEAQAIEHWSAGSGHAALVGGNPWLDLWRGDCRWPGVAQAAAAAGALKQRAGARPVVLVTLQFGLDPAEQLQPLGKLIRQAGLRFMFWVRLHPVMLAERESVRSMLGPDGAFELDQASDLPLHALLPNADLHITHSSSTVIEAAQFGVRSLITSRWGAELFEDLVASGWARVESGDTTALAAACTAARVSGLGLGLGHSRSAGALQQLLALSVASAKEACA